VPAEAILLEERAQNTGDNFSFGVPLLEQAGIIRRTDRRGQAHMTRRGFATGRKLRPEIELLDAVRGDRRHLLFLPASLIRNARLLALVGDLHRIIVYRTSAFRSSRRCRPW